MKQEIFDRLFLLMAARWRQLVRLIAEEQDPVRLNEMIGELNAIVLERKAAIEISLGKAAEPIDEPEAPTEEGKAVPLHMTVSSSR